MTFDTVTVRHTSASGILAGASAATSACSGNSTPSCVVIESSSFYDIGDSGIRVGHTPAGADTSATVVQGVMANNNLIQGYSRVFADGEGIAEGNGNNNQYVYNTITDGYHAGISICKDGCGPTADVPGRYGVIPAAIHRIGAGKRSAERVLLYHWPESAYAIRSRRHESYNH